jgi:hypothetical protein
MEKFIVDFVVNHFKTKTSKKKQINNQQLDLLIQTKLSTNPLSDR